ncbi:hypothetical protein R3W88_011521 [Solanum pinnatisectum]|uniref:Uncharacterized protein n=1 Tax=Solanum pinnatisectum TaxID=50273 RepID=A0AAV9L7P0_9SOLN|nr:hypothetical protein R3W88_011521 [Solanum pinnatisectum]
MDAKKQYYRIDGMSVAIQVWLYECYCAVDPNIAEKKTNRIPDWLIGGPYYELLMEGMFSDNNNPLKYKNIHPSLKEIAFYHLTKNNVIPENAFEKDKDKDEDEDDDFTSKPQTHKTNNKDKEKLKVNVPWSTPIKK